MCYTGYEKKAISGTLYPGCIFCRQEEIKILASLANS
jgi:hypothetical protein